jgi:hypothetical protein
LELKNANVGQAIAILANLGVIAGIVFLALELRQNNQLLVAQTSYAQFNVERERRMTRVEHSNLVVKELSGSPLTQAERYSVMLLNNDALDSFRWQFREYQAGRLPEDFIDLRTWRDVWGATPGLIELFEEDRAELEPEFVTFMEDAVLNDPAFERFFERPEGL